MAFKDEHPDYAGLTVNERLITAGLLQEFDKTGSISLESG